jgi:hypothetical protein
MYTQALNTSDAEDRNIEDAARAAQFQARIDAEERIEPNDWMPAAYRKTLTRQISQHAHSEIVGMLMMFGPPDQASLHGDTSTKWKIKRFSNDELRQKFVDATVPQAEYLGLTIPDPGMKQNEAGHWEYSAIDWNEFKQVLAGNGPCNRDRLAARRKAHDEGAWVREAAQACAEKRKQRLAAQAA